MPRFLPDLPKSQRDRIDTIVERQLEKFVAAAERRQRKKALADRRRGR
jgi:hypothetical protein